MFSEKSNHVVIFKREEKRSTPKSTQSFTKSKNDDFFFLLFVRAFGLFFAANCISFVSEPII